MRQATRNGGPPAPNGDYQRLKADLHRTIVESVDLSRLDRWKPDRVRTEVHALARDEARRADVKLSTIELDYLSEQVMAEVFGLGPIEPLMADPSVTEVLVNGPDSVYVERNGRLEPTDVRFTDTNHLTRVIQRIATRVGRRIDESSPMVDARLADGSRVNAVLPPLSADGPVLSVRRFGQVLAPGQLVENGSVTEDVMTFLEAAVAAKTNILISGGAGAGKTTLLNILAGYIPEAERLVTIEDTLELRLPHPHVVRTETRSANLEGIGAVTQRDLLRNSLRMRPDRIIVGEVRGAEAIDMLQAMNTGHEGSLTTIHANSPKDALARLEMIVRVAGFDVPVDVLRGYIANAIGLVVHVSRLRGGERKVTSVSEVLGVGKRGQYKLASLFEYVQDGVDDGHAFGRFRATGRVPRLLPKLSAAGFDVPMELFAPDGEVQLMEDPR